MSTTSYEIYAQAKLETTQASRFLMIMVRSDRHCVLDTRQCYASILMWTFFKDTPRIHDDIQFYFHSHSSVKRTVKCRYMFFLKITSYRVLKSGGGEGEKLG